jgi:predicted RNase H-like HicB family nuclease/predicted RNA binding protein YcfA (HicA-like mRNA interferase family)
VSVEKTLEKLLRGASDANIRFEEICDLLQAKGFRMRVSGSHHIFTKSGVMERINLQREGSKAKPYQVKQVRKIIAKYKLLWVMENTRYEMIIWWSDEDKAFVVDVPELPGCMAHGDTRAEAIASAEEAVAFWLKTAKEDGAPIPEPKGRLVVA